MVQRLEMGVGSLFPFSSLQKMSEPGGLATSGKIAAAAPFLPRNAGCHNCRERRIQCDGGRPTCEKCAKKKLECRGYDRKYRWVDQSRVFKPALPQSTTDAPRVKKQKRERSSSKARGSSLARQKSNSSATTVERIEKELAQVPLSSPDSSPSLCSATSNELGSAASYFSSHESSLPAPPPSLDLGGFSDLIYLSFTMSKLFSDSPEKRSPMPWLAEVASLPNPPRMVKLAISSLSAALFGRMHGVRNIIREGLVFYGMAIEDLKRTIASETHATELYPLVTTTILSVYELIVPTTTSAWHQHMRGTIQLLQLRGPVHHKSGLAHSIFKFNRCSIAIYFCCQRKRCFLADPEWKTIPWEDQLSSKTEQDHLEDLVCAFPGLIETFDTVKCLDKDSPLLPERQAAFSNELKSLLDTLIPWRENYERQNPGFCYETPAEQASELYFDEEGPVFDTVFHFKSLGVATDIMWCDTLFVFALALNKCAGIPLYSIVDVAKPVTKTNPLLLPSEVQSRRDYACELVRCMDYHLRAEHYSTGATTAYYPLQIAYSALEKGSREAACAERITQKMLDMRIMDVRDP